LGLFEGGPIGEQVLYFLEVFLVGADRASLAVTEGVLVDVSAGVEASRVFVKGDSHDGLAVGIFLLLSGYFRFGTCGSGREDQVFYSLSIYFGHVLVFIDDGCLFDLLLLRGVGVGVGAPGGSDLEVGAEGEDEDDDQLDFLLHCFDYNAGIRLRRHACFCMLS
jgi:hypothetical protein